MVSYQIKGRLEFFSHMTGWDWFGLLCWQVDVIPSISASPLSGFDLTHNQNVIEAVKKARPSQA